MKGELEVRALTIVGSRSTVELIRLVEIDEVEIAFDRLERPIPIGHVRIGPGTPRPEKLRIVHGVCVTDVLARDFREDLGAVALQLMERVRVSRMRQRRSAKAGRFRKAWQRPASS